MDLGLKETTDSTISQLIQKEKEERVSRQLGCSMRSRAIPN